MIGIHRLYNESIAHVHDSIRPHKYTMAMKVIITQQTDTITIVITRSSKTLCNYTCQLEKTGR